MSPRRKTVGGPPSAPVGVDRFDWEVVSFVLHWAPYGGADDDDVVPTFGMPYRQLEVRFAEIVNELAVRTVGGGLRLDRQQRELLRRAVKILPTEGQTGSGRPASPADSAATLSPTDGEWVVRRGLRQWRPKTVRVLGGQAGRAEIPGGTSGS